MSDSDREDRIRRRAYERYEERGREEGGDMDDWLAAESEEEALFDATKHAPPGEPAMPRREDVHTQPGPTEEASTGGAPGRGSISDREPQESAPPPKPDGEQKDDKINEAVEESFPASDAPAWRGGSAT